MVQHEVTVAVDVGKITNLHRLWDWMKLLLKFLNITWFPTLYLHQEAMLQSWGGFTMPDGLGGEEQLHQLLGAELYWRLDCWHHHPLRKKGRKPYNRSEERKRHQQRFLISFNPHLPTGCVGKQLPCGVLDVVASCMIGETVELHCW